MFKYAYLLSIILVPIEIQTYLFLISLIDNMNILTLWFQ